MRLIPKRGTSTPPQFHGRPCPYQLVVSHVVQTLYSIHLYSILMPARSMIQQTSPILMPHWTFAPLWLISTCLKSCTRTSKRTTSWFATKGYAAVRSSSSQTSALQRPSHNALPPVSRGRLQLIGIALPSCTLLQLLHCASWPTRLFSHLHSLWMPASCCIRLTCGRLV